MTAATLSHAPGQSRAVPRLLIGLAFLLAAVLVVALATGLAYWVERPAMRWLRTRWHRRKLRLGLV